MNRKWVITLMCLTLVTVLEDADAKRRRSRASKWANHGSKCADKTRVSATMYNLPVEGKVRNFRKAVRLQGSGITADGRRLSYTGKITPAPQNCTTTKTSASGQCLLSYFSIAADLDYHRAGDIIEVPALRGTRVRLPDSGAVIEHPGYFIVHDTGAAIKGKNRFDFFVGTDNPYGNSSAFAQKQLGNKFNCQKSFAKLERGSSEYQNALDKIYALTDSTQKSLPLRSLAHKGES